MAGELDPEGTPLPLRGGDQGDQRVVAAWREWLEALATDAEAALAAALAYQELDDEARDSWLSALEHDAPTVQVPKVAVYAPLLAVESDPVRRLRIQAALTDQDTQPGSIADATALTGLNGATNERIAVLIAPLYLDFVRVLACAYRVNEGFRWVKHDPILRAAEIPKAGDQLSGTHLESTPIKSVVDDLALAVLAHRRAGQELPEALTLFADLFVPVTAS